MRQTLVRLAARNTLRRPARTLLTAGMVVFGVAMLLIALTWINGAFGSIFALTANLSGHVRVVSHAFAEREELMPLDEHLVDTQRWIELLAKQPGVTAVEPRIMNGVTVTVGEEIGEVFALAVGASETYFRERLGAKEKLIEGGWFTGAPDELIVGAKVAKEVGAHVGDEMLLLGLTQDGSMSPIKGKIVGIVRAGGLLDEQIYAPLAKLQYLADIDDDATELLVYGARWQDSDALAARLKAVPELSELTVQSFAEREPWKTMGTNMRAVEGIIVSMVVFLTALGIWNTMMMSVLERTHEIGVLRALGLSKLGTVGLLVGEALAIALVGGAAGVALGAIPSWLLETNGIRIGEQVASNMTVAISETIHGDLSLEGAVTSFALGLLMAVLGSVVPAIRAAHIQPVSAMRSGR